MKSPHTEDSELILSGREAKSRSLAGNIQR
jgi:hypothetical protein